jgi:hypothetical protein
MSDKPRKSRIAKKPKRRTKEAVNAGSINSSQEEVTAQEYPESEGPLPIPCDKDTAKKVGNVIQLSYLDYLKQLDRASNKDNAECMTHLHNILSEFLGPYMLIGYLPDDEPIEIISANSQKDKEAVFERLRKTFMRHASNNMPG